MAGCSRHPCPGHWAGHLQACAWGEDGVVVREGLYLGVGAVPGLSSFLHRTEEAVWLCPTVTKVPFQGAAREAAPTPALHLPQSFLRCCGSPSFSLPSPF